MNPTNSTEFLDSFKDNVGWSYNKMDIMLNAYSGWWNIVA